MPFISVCGVTCERDVETIRTLVPLMPYGHVLAAGVLVSEKTLRGEAAESARYPAIAEVPGLLRALAATNARPVVHFNTREPSLALFERLLEVTPSAIGFQLNVYPWPEENLVRKLARHGFVILQWKGPHPEAAPSAALLDALSKARNRGATVVLCDASAGTGKPIDPTLAIQYINTWWSEGPALAPGLPAVDLALAGGLGPDAGDTLRQIQAQCPPRALNALSLCAETRTRRPREGDRRPNQDDLAPDLAAGWARVAAQFVAGSL